MIKYYIRDNGATYCEGPEQEMAAFPDAVEVPQRPATEMEWDGNQWVIDATLSKELVRRTVFAEINRLEKFKVFSTNIQIGLDLTTYLGLLKTYYDNGDYSAIFPTCPDSLLDRNFVF